MNMENIKNLSAAVPSPREIIETLVPRLVFASPEEERIKLRQLQEAIELTVELHANQRRKNNEPYMHHIVRVTRRLVDEYEVSNVDVIMVALLHDAVEDHTEGLCDLAGLPVSRSNALSYLSGRFGNQVSALVKDLSNPESKGKVPEEEWKMIYAKHVEDMIDKHPDLLCVKLSDFTENALKLYEITDLNERVRLSKKYLPTMRVFLERVGRPNTLPEKAQAVILEKLKTTIAETERLIAENSTDY